MCSQARILIIGAGIAGLAAAQKLISQHFKVTILEARNRLGGRTWTDYSLGVPFDLGAYIIHGIKNNPITELAKKFNVKYHCLERNSIMLIDKNNRLISCDQIQDIDIRFKQLLQHAGDFARKSNQDMPLSQALDMILQQNQISNLLHKDFRTWKSMHLSLYTGAETKYLSARYWDQEETLEGGNHIMLNGYKPIITGLARNLDIQLNVEVKRISYHHKKILVETNQGIYEADMVISTLPLGALQNNSILFEPALPIKKLESIHNLKMCLFNKIALRFPKVFWPEHYQRFSYLSDNYRNVPWFINFHHYFKEPILMGYINGDLAYEMEKLNDAEISQQAYSVLQKIFGNSIPKPISQIITRWSSDRYTHGAYSFIPPGANGKEYDTLAEPVENRLFFAGEATHRQHPASTHGAYLSGIREANRIIKLFDKKRNSLQHGMFSV